MEDMLKEIDYSHVENKEKMNSLFEMLVCNVEKTDPELYDYVKTELYEMIYGKKLNETLAKKWVEKMKPAAKWNMDQVKAVLQKYNIQIPLCDAYAIMNMYYSDKKDILGEGDTEESLEKYLKAVKDWYFDEDLKITGQEKTYLYYKYIVCAK